MKNMGKKRKKIFSAKFFDFQIKLFISLADKINLKERVLEHISHNEQKILDLFCKTGDMAVSIAKSRPQSQIIGLESNDRFLRYAKRKKRTNIAKNLELMNLSNIDFHYNSFDTVTIYFALSDMTIDAINKIFIEVKKLLKNNKTFIIVDYSNAKNKISTFFSNLYYKILNLKQIKEFLQLDLQEILIQNGFRNINIEEYNCLKLISSTK